MTFLCLITIFHLQNLQIVTKIFQTIYESLMCPRMWPLISGNGKVEGRERLRQEFFNLCSIDCFSDHISVYILVTCMVYIYVFVYILVICLVCVFSKEIFI